jgi:uracil DNA glycosylase
MSGGGFRGSKTFVKANEALKKLGHETLDWGVPE